MLNTQWIKMLNRRKLLALLLFVFVGQTVYADELDSVFVYHATFEYDGWEYAINLSDDVGKAYLVGPASTSDQASSRRPRKTVLFGPYWVWPEEIQERCLEKVPPTSSPDGSRPTKGYLCFDCAMSVMMFVKSRSLTPIRTELAEVDDDDKVYTVELQVIGQCAVMGNEDVVTIEIPNTVTTIWQGAFACCPNLESVTIPSSVRALGYGAFGKCTKLASINIPGSVKHIGENAFIGCTALESATLNEGVKQIDGGIFSECHNLSSLSLPSSLEYIGAWAFNETSSLKQKITLPKSLKSIEEYAFFECGLTELDFAEDAVIQTIGENAFDDCDNLEKVTLPASLKTIGASAFQVCPELKEVTLPPNLISIGQNAFGSCFKLATITCQQTTPIDIPDNTFYSSVYKTATLKVPKGTKDLYKAANGWKNFLKIDDGTDNSNIISFVDENVKAICVANWDTNGDGELSMQEAEVVTDFKSAFRYNTDITSFDELKYFTALTQIGAYEFQGCTQLRSVIIPKNVSNMYGSCPFERSGLETIAIDTDNPYLNLTDGIIYNKNKTTVIAFLPFLEGSITLPGTVTEIGYQAGASWCDVTNITLPASLKKIKFGGLSGFRCQTLHLPAQVESVIGRGSISEYCKEITVESGNQHFESIDGVLYSKGGTTLVAYPYSKEGNEYAIVDGTQKIAEYAFYCDNLTKLVLPSTISSLESWAIPYCKIEQFICNCATPPLAKDAFPGITVSNVIVPTGSKEAYQVADGWKAFNNIQEAEVVSLPKATITYANSLPLDFSTPIEGLKAYVVSDVTDGFALLTEVTEAVPAGTGLILKGTAGQSYAILTAATASVIDANMLVGVTANTAIGGNGLDYILQDGKFVKANAGTINAGKAYLRLDVALARQVIEIDEGTTGIDSNLRTRNTNVLFNLKGQRIRQPAKGLYIVNGRKIFIK